MFYDVAPEAYTYATRLGTNVIDIDPDNISLPNEYVLLAAKYAESEVEFKFKKQENHPKMEKDKHMAIFVKAVCTLEYASWNGFMQPPYHYNGIRPFRPPVSGPVFTQNISGN